MANIKTSNMQLSERALKKTEIIGLIFLKKKKRERNVEITKLL
jgi:hypothetical protein